MKSRDFLMVTDDEMVEVILPDDLKIPSSFELVETQTVNNELYYYWKLRK